MKPLLLLLLTLFSSAELRAELHPQNTEKNAKLSATDTVNTDSGVLGGINIRPSTDGGKGFMYTFNDATLGYKFNKDINVFYQQQFITNINDPNKNGLQPSLFDGYGAVQATIWRDKKNGWELVYEPRIYLPTDPVKQGQGLIGFSRQYLKLKKTVNQNFVLSFWEIPIPWAYSQDGYQDEKGLHANPVFDNWFYVIPEFVSSDGKWDISLPIAYGARLYRNYLLAGDTIDNNGAWGHSLWIEPEIDYNITPHFALGVALWSQSFIANDFSGFTFGDGFGTGTYMMVFHVGL